MKLIEYDLFEIFIAEKNKQPKTISANITDCVLKIAKALGFQEFHLYRKQ